MAGKVCLCACHGEDVPQFADPIAIATACSRCHSRHALALINCETPYEPPGERKPFDPKSDSQKND